MDQWDQFVLNILKQRGISPDSNKMIIGNKTDLDPVVTKEEGQKLGYFLYLACLSWFILNGFFGNLG
jgi:hypothetical protein